MNIVKPKIKINEVKNIENGCKKEYISNYEFNINPDKKLLISDITFAHHLY